MLLGHPLHEDIAVAKSSGIGRASGTWYSVSATGRFTTIACCCCCCCWSGDDGSCGDCGEAPAAAALGCSGDAMETIVHRYDESVPSRRTTWKTGRDFSQTTVLPGGHTSAPKDALGSRKVGMSLPFIDR